MTTAVETKPKLHDDVEVDTSETKPDEHASHNHDREVAPAEQTDPTEATVYDSIENDNGMLLNDIALEAEVVSFIKEYRGKELPDIEQPAVVLSKLRVLYTAYTAKIERSSGITRGVLTKYGIQRGMLLNIEKLLLEHSGRQWLEHYTREYGEKSLRTAQDYMKLGNTSNILNYAVIGKERLMKILRAIRILGIEGEDPIDTLFQKCGISFDPEESYTEEKMSELKLGIDNAIAKSRIRKAEEQREIELGVNFDLIENLLKAGISVSTSLINDLFELKSEGCDVNRHLESLCGDPDGGDDMLQHIKKVSSFPKIVDRLKSTVESLSQNSGLFVRIEQSHIDDLEQYVNQIKNLYQNHNTHD